MKKGHLLLSFFIFAITLLILLYLKEFVQKSNFTTKSQQVVTTRILKTDDINVSKPLLDFMRIRDMHAGKKIEVTKKIEDRLLYQVSYYYDQFGLRNTSVSQGDFPHLIVAGCSGVFGEGVGEESTVARLLSKKMNRPVLNFGIAGSAHHDHIDFLNLIPKDYIKNQKGIYIFFYWDDLLKRATLDPSYLMWSGPDRPYFDFDKSGHLKRMGTIKDSEKWKNYQRAKELNLEHSFLSLQSQSQSGFSDENIALSAAMILELKKTYLTYYPEGRFLFSFHPLFATNLEHKEKIASKLKTLGVEILSLSSVDLNQPEKIYIPLDGHPSENGYIIFSDILARALSSFY